MFTNQSTSNSYAMGCPPVPGDNPRALASGLSNEQADKHGIPPTSAFCLFDLINNISIIKERSRTKLGLMGLAQGHNTVSLVRLEPVAPRSRVKHSTTEPLRSDLHQRRLCTSRDISY